MIRRTVQQQGRMSREALDWNAFVDILAMEQYEDLEPVQRIPHLAFWYESEVQNGGHSQYFENCGTDLLQETLEALTALGAHEQRKVLAKASELYLSQADDGEADLDGEFEDFDTAYHECQPDMNKLLEQYLDKHRDSFIED